MSTLQTETGDIPKRRGFRFWIGCFTLVFGLPIWLYYCYCWGVWGRNSLLLQYLFQCNCPATSEKARYPKEVDIIIPACHTVNLGVKLSPGGRFLYLREEKNGLASAYLLDLQTMEKIDVTHQRFSEFATDDLWFVENGIEDYLIDRKTGMQYPTKTFRNWRDNAYVNGSPNLELLVAALHQAEQVFLIQNKDIVVVLMPNTSINFEQNITFNSSDIPGGDPNRVEQFLRLNNITYQTALEDFPHEVRSPDGKFIARDDGIYFAGTHLMIIKTPVPGVRGWTYDGRGVIYTSSRCLFYTSFPGDGGCLRWVPQPVIKLKVPEEYFSPTQMP